MDLGPNALLHVKEAIRPVAEIRKYRNPMEANLVLAQESRTDTVTVTFHAHVAALTVPT